MTSAYHISEPTNSSNEIDDIQLQTAIFLAENPENDPTSPMLFKQINSREMKTPDYNGIVLPELKDCGASEEYQLVTQKQLSQYKQSKQNYIEQRGHATR